VITHRTTILPFTHAPRIKSKFNKCVVRYYNTCTVKDSMVLAVLHHEHTGTIILSYDNIISGNHSVIKTGIIIIYYYTDYLQFVKGV
jgi:hypothetical protein